MVRNCIGEAGGTIISEPSGVCAISGRVEGNMNRDQKIGFLIGLTASDRKYANMMKRLAFEWQIDLATEVKPSAELMIVKLAGMAIEELKGPKN